ncbi:hypothetical protein CDEST_13671 [Colletotrichum destructivum]|uniref:Uncharacterized protein n=1 Tax=Colletotrichum destructivum TaxID=34406 RepID=A0AAX4IZG1_9PEZI|nr:hypothetical protein CDEST_13671 [Colletotrichum destructivum]
MDVSTHCAACHGPRAHVPPLTWRGKEAAILAPDGCFLIAIRRRGWEGLEPGTQHCGGQRARGQRSAVKEDIEMA